MDDKSSRYQPDRIYVKDYEQELRAQKYFVAGGLVLLSCLFVAFSIVFFLTQ